MKSSVKAIIFDFGGVLIDWDPRNLYRHYFLDQPQAMDDFLTEIDFFAWNAHQDRGRSFAEGNAQLISKFPQYTELIQAYFDNYENSIVGAIDETVTILRTLKNEGYPLFGLSNWSAETFPRAQKIYPFFKWFDEIVLSGRVKINKPDHAIYKLLLKKIGYPAEECVLIDDTIANIKSAQTLGFQTIHFTTAKDLQLELQRLGVL